MLPSTLILTLLVVAGHCSDTVTVSQPFEVVLEKVVDQAAQGDPRQAAAIPEHFPLRAVFDFSYIEGGPNILQTWQLNYLQTTMKDVVIPWLSNLSVLQPKTYSLPENSTCAHDGRSISIPKLYTTPYEYDLVVLVTALSVHSSEPLAFPCVVNDIGRPIFGYLNISPSIFPAQEDLDIHKEALLGIFKHSVMHILGFNADFWYTGKYIRYLPSPISTEYRYENIPVDQIVNTTVHGEGDDQYTTRELILPAVVSATQEHFGCAEITGAPIEDLDEEHLEKRFFNSEVMTNSIEFYPAVSKISLSVLESSGWYKVNYTEMVDSYQWGLDSECQILSDCSKWRFNGSCQPTWTSQRNSTITAAAPQCMHDHQGYSSCNINGDYLIEEYHYRHWQSRTIGSLSKSADHCGIIGLDGSQPYPGTVWCHSGQDDPSTGATYSLGSSTLAYTDSIEPSLVEPNPEGPVCYKTQCLDKGRAMVLLGSYWYECSDAKSVITDVLHFSGEVTCPPYSVVCPGVYDSYWPAISSVQPRDGSCDVDITLQGTFALGYNYTVTFDKFWPSPCEVSSVTKSEIKCSLPCGVTFSYFTEDTSVSIIVTASDGKTAFVYDAYSYHVPFTQTWKFEVLLPAVVLGLFGATLLAAVGAFVIGFKSVHGIKTLVAQREAELSFLSNEDAEKQHSSVLGQ